jgi:hypothetical protein
MARTTRTRFGKLTWMGDELRKHTIRAAKSAIDRTTEASAERARTHHRGWRSRTGTAEGSIGTRPARLLKNTIRGSVTGGEGDAFHLLILEVKNGSALRSAADVEFPQVQDRLREEFGG